MEQNSSPSREPFSPASEGSDCVVAYARHKEGVARHRKESDHDKGAHLHEPAQKRRMSARGTYRLVLDHAYMPGTAAS
eukprot:363221-Chlamydomonas_euryale.AAC.24